MLSPSSFERWSPAPSSATPLQGAAAFYEYYTTKERFGQSSPVARVVPLPRLSPLSGGAGGCRGCRLRRGAQGRASRPLERGVQEIVRDIPLRAGRMSQAGHTIMIDKVGVHRTRSSFGYLPTTALGGTDTPKKPLSLQYFYDFIDSCRADSKRLRHLSL